MPGEVPSDVPPAAFGRFRVLHQIGAGSLGPVFRGEDPETHEPVAIKYLRLNVLPEEAGQLVEALRALVERVPRHPGLTRIIAVGQHELDPYVVTSLATGESLDVALREYGPATIVDALPRLKRLAEALDLAASRGVWHGALQPRDILVSAQETQLAGLGIAPVLERAGVRRSMRRPYAAPEVVDGGPTSAAADQYALAAVAYEWLFGGRAPRSAESVLDAPALAGVDAEKLAGALMTALAPDPAQRFATCTSFVDAMRQSVVDAGGMASPVAERPSTPAPVPLPLDIDEPERGPALLPDDHIIEIAPPALGLADLELDAEPPSAHPLPPRPEPPPPRESRPRVAWQGSLGASPGPVHESSRDGYTTNTLIAALIGGILIGSIGGYVVGVRRSAPPERGGSNTPPAQPVAEAPSGSGREFTDAPVGAAPAGVRQPPAAVTPTQPVASNTAPGSPAATADAASARRDAPARLLVRSSPPGASVAIDGTPQGTTPAAIRELALGTRTVVVSRPGYVSVERRITLTADRPSRLLEVQLTPVAVATRAARTPRPEAAPASLTVDSRPPGASVTIDGKPSGTTPLTIASISPGKHTVRIERDGYRAWTQVIEIKPGERSRVAASLVGGQEEE